MIKPVTKVPFGFSVGWFNPPDGPPRRPLTAVEARKVAAQEWAKLMIEPPCKWHHPLITQYKDEFGRPRGTINLEVACNAPQAILPATLLWHTWDLLSLDTL